MDDKENKKEENKKNINNDMKPDNEPYNVTREINAWNIGKTIANFQSDTERYIFEKIKEYALATYNYGNLKDIVAENNVEKYIKSLL